MCVYQRIHIHRVQGNFFLKNKFSLKRLNLYKHEQLSHLKLKTEADIDSKFCV